MEFKLECLGATHITHQKVTFKSEAGKALSNNQATKVLTQTASVSRFFSLLF